MNFINLEKFNGELDSLKQQYQAGKPFPHVVLDDFFLPDVADKIIEEFPNPNDEKWKYFKHVNKVKETYGGELSPYLKSVWDALNSAELLNFFSRLTGTDNLVYSDLIKPTIHRVGRDGFMNLHADAVTVRHENKIFQREFTVYIFMNKDWRQEYKGDLEFWDPKAKKCVTRITPGFNRCAIFKITPDGYHGLPEKLKCPENVYRMAIGYAGFAEGTDIKSINGKYVYRPADNLLKKAAIVADRELVATFKNIRHKIKGY